jgi:hypothetical protein
MHALLRTLTTGSAWLAVAVCHVPARTYHGMFPGERRSHLRAYSDRAVHLLSRFGSRGLALRCLPRISCAIRALCDRCDRCPGVVASRRLDFFVKFKRRQLPAFRPPD